MASLASIERKLDELVKQKADAEPKEPTQEEKDEERMREIEAKIKDLVDLLSGGVSRESADQRIGDARERVKSAKGEPRPLLRVYHDHGGKRIPTTRRTQVLPCRLVRLSFACVTPPPRRARCTSPRP
jgi:hypothetical protein